MNAAELTFKGPEDSLISLAHKTLGGLTLLTSCCDIASNVLSECSGFQWRHFRMNPTFLTVSVSGLQSHSGSNGATTGRFSFYLNHVRKSLCITSDSRPCFH